MPIGDGKAKKEAQDLKQEFAFMYDAITSLGDKLIGSFEQAVDEAGNMNSAFEIASKTFQRGLAADLKQSVKNTDALIDLYSKLGRDAITQKDIAKEQEKIDSNRLRLQIKRKALGNNITAQQKEFFLLQQNELSTQQNMLNTINAKNDKLQKQKGIFQLIKENAGGVADKIDKSGTLSKVLSGNLLKTLTPLRIFELVVVGIVDSFLSLDKTTEKVAQNLGISFHEAAGMNQQFSQIARDSNNIFVTTEGIANSQIQLSAALGTNAMFTAEMLQTQTELTHQLGLSAETGGEIAKLGLLTGKTSKEIAANVMGQSVAMNAANKTAITEKSILQEVAKLSSSIQLSLGNNPVELAKAVQTAKQFGMELSNVDGIAGSLMNFEQSIGAELEAELLLGKNINLEKARQAALDNDLATVAEEIAKQAGSAAEFTAMNRIQQEALAKAVGMSKEDLAKSLQSREILAKLGGKDANMQAAYNRLKAEGLSQEEIANKLGDERLAQSLHSEGIQSQFTASVAKMKELFVQVAAALIPIVEPIAAAVGFMANLISKSMTFLKVLGSIAAVYKTLQFLGDSVYRNELLRNAASKIGLITDQQKVLNKGRETALAVEGVGVEQLSNFHKNQGLLTQIKTNLQKKLGNQSLLKGVGLYIQQSALKAKDFVVEKAGYLLILAKNAATLIYNGILTIGNAIKKSGLLASIAEMAMRAYSSLSAIPFIGPILGVAGAASALALGYSFYSKADDMVSPGGNGGGYGNRTLMGPEGAIALNNKDTVIAGTNLFPKENKSINPNSEVSKPQQTIVQQPTVVQQDNSKLEKLLERSINRPDPVIEMNGDRLGTAVGKYAYSVQ
jgi:hypothetical protein